MAHHLSPSRPIGLRFRVPGEDAYTLTRDFYSLPPARTTAPAASSSGQSGTPSSSGSNTATGTARTASPALNGPLGLATTTMISVARGRKLVERAAGDDGRSATGDGRGEKGAGRSGSGGRGSDGNASAGGGSIKGGGGSMKGGGGSIGSSSSQTVSNSLFSLKKIAVLGSSITSKFTSSESSPKSAGPKAPPKVATGSQSGLSATSGVVRRAKPQREYDIDAWSLSTNDGFLAYNYGDSVCFSDISSKDSEPVQTIKMRSTPTCHELRKFDNAVRMIVGCANGEVAYFQDVSGATGAASCTNLFNKDGAINSTRVTAVRWLPRPQTPIDIERQTYQHDKAHPANPQNIQDPFAFSSYRFVVTHLDGCIILYDIRYKQTASGSATSPPSTSGDSKANLGTASHLSSSGFSSAEDAVHSKPSGHRRTAPSSKHEVIVRRNSRSKKSNPIMMWYLPECGAINAAQFSPCPIPQPYSNDHRQANETYCLALACRDGYLRILDFTFNYISLALRSYYGAIISVTWSPDGKYIATGGEDDLVSIWDPVNRDILARCAGHTSWVSNVSWDLPTHRKESGRYRIASAGQDAKLILWDFQSFHLRHRPGRGTRLPTYSGRDSESSRSNGYSMKTVSSSVTASFGSSSVPSVAGVKPSKLGRLRKGGANHTTNETYHVAPPTQVVDAKPRAVVPVLEPICAHFAHSDPLTDIRFVDAGLLTADCQGVVKLWSRPMASRIPALSLNDTEGEISRHLEKQRAADLD